MQNDAGECIYSVTLLTRRNMFRSRIGNQIGKLNCVPSGHAPEATGPRSGGRRGGGLTAIVGLGQTQVVAMRRTGS
jgi:hypothetical protein